MNGLNGRLSRLESSMARRRPAFLQDMTDDELAQAATGDPDAKAADVSDEDLRQVLHGGDRDVRQ